VFQQTFDPRENPSLGAASYMGSIDRAIFWTIHAQEKPNKGERDAGLQFNNPIRTTNENHVPKLFSLF